MIEDLTVTGRLATAQRVEGQVCSGLDQLELRLQQDLGWLNLPAKSWVEPRSVDGETVRDVVVIGGGICGLVTLAGLWKSGVHNIVGLDSAPAGREGPWVTYGRMETLRTRKEISGLALGIPSLTFRAWFEAQFGADAFAAMPLIPRTQWMEYLVWYRRVLALPLRNDTRVTAVELRADGLFDVRYDDGAAGHVVARRVVLATGLDGMGAPSLPAVAETIAKRYYAHGAELIDMAALAGKRVAVVGAGASAMDNAAAALEAGSASVDLFVRRPELPRFDRFSSVASNGMIHGYYGLSDAARWTITVEGERSQVPPPRHSVLRVSRHAQARFHVGSPILQLVENAGDVTVVTPKGRYDVDFIIFATGFGIDLAKRPEFSGLAPLIRTWANVYQPPAGQEHAGLALSPYLGANFEFLPAAGAAAGISRAYCFAYPAVTSHGKITSGVPSISEGANRLVQGIARSLFVEDEDRLLARFAAGAVAELIGDEWTDADLALDQTDE